MNLKTIKATIAVGWVGVLVATGLIADVTSSSWLALAACAIVPPFVMMRYWNHPDETTSQSIQQILR